MSDSNTVIPTSDSDIDTVTPTSDGDRLDAADAAAADDYRDIKQLVFYIGFIKVEEIRDILEIILTIKKNTQSNVKVIIYFSVSFMYLQQDEDINYILQNFVYYSIDLNDVVNPSDADNLHVYYCSIDLNDVPSDADRILYIYCHGENQVIPVFNAFIMKKDTITHELKSYCNNVVLQEKIIDSPYLATIYTGLIISHTSLFYTIIFLHSCLSYDFFTKKTIPEKVICFQQKEMCNISSGYMFYESRDEQNISISNLKKEGVVMICNNKYDCDRVIFGFPTIDPVVLRVGRNEYLDEDDYEYDEYEYDDDDEQTGGRKFIKINKKKTQKKKTHKKKTHKKKTHKKKTHKKKTHKN